MTKSAGFALAVGDTLTIMEFSGRTGDFTSFDYTGAACSLLSIDLWGRAHGVQIPEQFVSDNMLNLVVETS